MANINSLDYSNIENPYNNLLERVGDSDVENSSNNVELGSFGAGGSGGNSGGVADSGGGASQEENLSENSFGNIWLRDWIKSANYKPKAAGFYIDGISGRIECMNIYVEGEIVALSGVIGGFTITDTKLYGGIIQTAETVGAGSSGVIIDSDGLRGYDSVLGNTFNLPTDGSAPTFSSGIINSTIFEINTNAVLRTSETVGDGTASSAGILINNTGLYGCEANQTLANANVKVLIDGSIRITGEINATSGKFGTSANYWNVGSTGLTATSSSGDVVIKYNKTDFGQDSTAGFILGYDFSASKSKFEIGSSATNILKYDGTDINLIGGNIIGSTFKTSDISLPDVQIDSVDGITVSGESIWFAVPAIDATTMDSYSESNYVSGSSLYSGSVTYRGQAFAVSSTKDVGSCVFYMKKRGSPTGNAVAYLYAHTGTYGVNGKPTGDPIATSDNLDVSTLTTSPELTTFTFSNLNKITLNSGTKYFVVVYYNGGDINNYIDVGKDNSSPTHGGTSVYSSDGSTWNSSTSVNFCFYVYSRTYGTEAGRISASTNPYTGIKIINQSKSDLYSGYAITIDSGYQDIYLSGKKITLNSLNGHVSLSEYLHLIPVSTAPESPTKGDIYCNNGNNHLYFYNGSGWVQLDN